MEKLNPETPDLAQAQIEQLRELFPECVTEGPDGLAVDFDALRQTLSSQIVEGPQERYVLDWPGKREAAAMANQATNKTLRPARDESVDFDTTQNLFIEGDNLEALKLIQETYLGQVKMIYIDPPYNTGNDFIYRDDFKQAREDYEAESGQRNEAGDRLVPNPESAGRFHSDWLSMMYPRLKLAKNLLADDGVIFISIDDSEKSNLKRLCDEIFGEANFLSELVWKKKYIGGKHAKHIVDLHEYILVYSRSASDLHELLMHRPDEEVSKFSLEDQYVVDRGKHYIRPLKSNLGRRETLIYPIEMPDGAVIETQWMVSKETLGRLIDEGRIVFKRKKDGTYNIYRKYYQFDNDGRVKVPSIIEAVSNADGKVELKKLFELTEGRAIPFENPKPSKLLNYLIAPTVINTGVVVDFFAGSSSTAHAVMQLNAEDGGNRRFIMVQLPEVCPKDSEAFKAGYKTIAEISKERIRRAGQKIMEGECHQDWNKDIGFRVLKVDESNLNAVRQTPDAASQESLLDAVENIKPDRSEEDLLFDVMMRWGVDLAAPIERRDIDGKTVFLINEDDLVACFDPSITEDFVKRLTDLKPLKIVFRDDAFASDDVKINTVQIFKQASPDTEVRSI